MHDHDDPFDIFSQQARGNHALYEQMRTDDPIHRAIDPQSGQVVWFLTRYDDCVSFMKDRRFSKEDRTRSGTRGDTHDSINRNMLNLDEPDHTRLKTLVHKAFNSSSMNTLRPRLQTIAERLLAGVDQELPDGEEFDLTEGYAEAFSLRSIMEMLGLPEADTPQFRIWTKTMLMADEETAHGAIIEFSMYMHRQIDVRREQAVVDDVLSGLIFAEDAGERLSRQELLAMVLLLFAAGYETVASLISNGVLSLFEHPDQLAMLRDHLDEPLIVNSAIEEMLRYQGPSYMTLPSWAFEAVAMGGKVIEQGDRVHAVLYAANRDPAVFAQPDKFDILRSPNKHVAFSQGLHHCLGAPLARLESEIAIVTLLRWMPNLLENGSVV